MGNHLRRFPFLRGQPGLGENECIFLIATVGLSVDYTVGNPKPGARAGAMALGGTWGKPLNISRENFAKLISGETSW